MNKNEIQNSIDLPIVVGHQGIVGSFSYIATKQIYPKAKIVSFNTFIDVINAVKDEKISFGIIPLENSYAGRVADVYNIFKDTKLYIVGEKLLKIQHNLAGIYGSKITDIKKIFSHEQALKQCGENLLKILPNVELIATKNTAISANYVSKEKNKHYACVCSIEAVKEYNLKLLKKNIQDKKNNSTLFVVFAKKPISICKNAKNVLTSIIFEIKNEVGSLYKCLECFAKNNIDLIKIESYIPNAFCSKSAMFFITMKGNIENNDMRNSLKELKKYSKNIHIFGSYLSDRDI